MIFLYDRTHSRALVPVSLKCYRCFRIGLLTRPNTNAITVRIMQVKSPMITVFINIANHISIVF